MKLVTSGPEKCLSPSLHVAMVSATYHNKEGKCTGCFNHKMLQLVHKMLQLVHKMLQLVHKMLQLVHKMLQLVHKSCNAGSCLKVICFEDGRLSLSLINESLGILIINYMSLVKSIPNLRHLVWCLSGMT